MGENQVQQGLYSQSFEHDNCGIGAVVNIKGRKDHQIVADALKIVEQLEHRAGKDAEGKTGDGVGILTQISHRFFSRVCQEIGIELGGEREYGIGMFFFPQNELKRSQAKKMFEIIVEKEGMKFLGWREVPTAPEVLGHKARECMPVICQGFVKKPENIAAGLDFDRKLYVVRRVFEQSNDNTYVPSLSSRTIVYKGMFLVGQLRTFFKDLQDAEYDSAIAIVHSRFSTNTNPSWERAHPNRFIVHNGEINTIKGNADKMLAREETMCAPRFSADDLTKVLPVVNTNGSDSAMLDNTLEFLVMSGMELPLAVMITIPEPWTHNDTISQEGRDFYQYYATMMEPWDGPASILFSDGDLMGAVLDRNGLRPSRYYITDDDRLILSSEVGVLDIPAEHILKKERLHPGKMLLVDTVKGEVLTDEEIKETYAKREPYGEWLDSNLVTLHELKIPNERIPSYNKEERARLQKAFGYTYEEYREGICSMALNGTERIGAMGVDTPLAVLSKEYQPLFYYFKQLFAQVTNPPIDAVREKIVTSTTVYAGKNGNLLEEKPENCQVLKINNPILTDLDLLKIRTMKKPGFKVVCVPIIFYKSTPMDRVLEHLFVQVDKAYREGANILILSDRGVDENHVAIPSLLAVSAVHKHLVKTKKCTALSIILESGEPREVHDFAALLGYGACAVNPYLAHSTIAELVEDGLLNKDYYAAVEDYDHAILQGIVKIASKMGISTIQSYQGSQIFEAIGISQEVIDAYFTGTVSRIGGITLKDIAAQTDAQHSKAFDPLGLATDLTLSSMGRHKMRSQGEEHRYNPQTIHMLQQAARDGSYEKFCEYTKMVDKEETGYLRSLMDFNFPETGVPIEEVESVESIVKRFKTGAMSYGSISEEAHEALAIAMNKLHGKSNSGEGGESDERLESAGTDHDRSSAIKQVASGRFGVTSRYLVSAREIQIKMAQGAKPGEGGHLPAKKVYPWIAKTRHSTPGVSLISPPPHHDIYSIEDLAQLIFDLKNVNPQAKISVKLVAESGVGTIAAGVAKAKADLIVISGAEGGTGASPASSIRYAGISPELGLSETQQTLVLNGLRGQVVLQADGQLKTGRDIILMALMGAEEYGFATSALIVLGCVMMRKCHQNTCPVGVATQNEELRKRFHGRSEYLVNFFTFLAQEVREHLAEMGFTRMDDIIGRTDLIERKSDANDPNPKHALIDFTKLLARVDNSAAIRHVIDQDHGISAVKDVTIIDAAQEAIEHEKEISLEYTIANTDRAIGAMLSGVIAKKYGAKGLPEHTLNVKFKGSAGQSFGAFLVPGVNFKLEGEANDYLGKGLSGGRISVLPPIRSNFEAEKNTIAGNTLLYGATSGEVYINGRVGERFAVRNSGAVAVVEGVGDHCCEYMTGGRVVVLGQTGRNFAAGMSGGVAYVWNKDGNFDYFCNMEMVELSLIEEASYRKELHELIRQHYLYTGSKLARILLDNWNHYVDQFIQVVPIEYKKVLQEEQMRKLQQKIADMQRDY